MSRMQIFLPSIEGKKSISIAENATDKEEGIKRILNMSLKKKKKSMNIEFSQVS